MTSRLGKIYNHKKDVLDGTEPKFGAEHFTVDSATLPSSYDLRVQYKDVIPPIIDQGNCGTCAACELSQALRFAVGKETGAANKEWQPSRLFIYYWARHLEGSPADEDTGITIHGGVQAIKKYGACSEVKWPYVISQFSVEPPKADEDAAHWHTKGFSYQNVPQDLTHIKQAIVAGKNIVIGIQVFESFESEAVAATGVVPMPDVNTEKCLGGHSVGIYGFSDADQRFIMMNTWGSQSWGQQGWFTIPYEYILNPDLSSDFWVVNYFK